MYRISTFSLGVASSNFWLPLTVQGAGLGLIFVPLTTVTNDPIPRERMGNATSIFNLMRNIGASIGIAMVETMQVRKAQMHINILDEHVNPANPLARQTIDGAASAFHVPGQGCGNRDSHAYGAVWGMVQQQAAMLAYNDVFRFLALMFVCDVAAAFPDAQTEEGWRGDGSLIARPRTENGQALQLLDP